MDFNPTTLHNAGIFFLHTCNWLGFGTWGTIFVERCCIILSDPVLQPYRDAQSMIITVVGIFECWSLRIFPQCWLTRMIHGSHNGCFSRLNCWLCHWVELRVDFVRKAATSFASHSPVVGVCLCGCRWSSGDFWLPAPSPAKHFWNPCVACLLVQDFAQESWRNEMFAFS